MGSRRTTKLAPLAALLLLGALLGWNEAERSAGGEVGAYRAQIRERIRAVPYSIGSYYGADKSVDGGVVKLLHPNEMLQREYVRVGSEGPGGFSLLVVHCTWADDLNGHYPPVCYPRSGWQLEQTDGREAEDVVIPMGEIDIPARRYRFRMEEGAVAHRKDILSFFVVPTGNARFGGDIRLVDLASRQPSTAKLGAAQVQILTRADMPEDERRALWEQVVTELAPVLATIAEGA